MGFIYKKVEQVYGFIDEFKKNNCYNEHYEKFFNIFSPLFFNESSLRMEIQVGKIISKIEFIPWLSMITKKFIVTPFISEGGKDLNIVIKDCSNNTIYSVACVALSMMSNLSVKSTNAGNTNFHDIEFSYRDVDYVIRIIVD